jgi:hypothetical protein
MSIQLSDKGLHPGSHLEGASEWTPYHVYNHLTDHPSHLACE